MDGSDSMNYLEKQFRDAKDNYNFFFVKLVFDILKILVKLSIILLISSIFNYFIVNIIVFIYIFYVIFNIYNLSNYYFGIISDIKETMGYSDLSFEIDFSLININYLKGALKYGK